MLPARTTEECGDFETGRKVCFPAVMVARLGALAPLYAGVQANVRGTVPVANNAVLARVNKDNEHFS